MHPSIFKSQSLSHIYYISLGIIVHSLFKALRRISAIENQKKDLNCKEHAQESILKFSRKFLGDSITLGRHCSVYYLGKTVFPLKQFKKYNYHFLL